MRKLLVATNLIKGYHTQIERKQYVQRGAWSCGQKVSLATQRQRLVRWANIRPKILVGQQSHRQTQPIKNEYLNSFGLVMGGQSVVLAALHSTSTLGQLQHFQSAMPYNVIKRGTIIIIMQLLTIKQVFVDLDRSLCACLERKLCCTIQLK